ncbi:hypothetical protein PRZ48_007852 [Zasmidium cellare]|uniref:Queuine tRNA-ribosyltransferase accessory subunit 2 n=1 Tax=Zasmidium cellare TaxID=395010 RepID=A0ABR0ELK7_ZASCE|nr:hypothetical protein PRZ48_007852 [Zasmidium cellare]
MDGTANGSLSELPDEMFSIIQSTAHTLSPRLARLSLPGRRIIDTPHYLANTSRGVVPHITQDTFRRDTSIAGVYVALEDFIERAPRKVPPLYQFKPSDGASPLRKFVALQDDALLVLGARRTPPVIAPAANSNTDTTVSICTAVGFRQMKVDDYAEEAEELKPDILVGLGDVPYGRVLGNKRVERATDRMIQWMQEHVALRDERKDGHQAKLFAPLLPVECVKQQFYADCLAEELAKDISGLALYDLSTLEDIPESLAHLPRLGFTEPKTPHEVLQQVALGLDILTVPFIGAATDAGIALDFTFPSRQILNGSGPQPLGVDMWSAEHAVDLSPLSKDCQCYACSNHHRAYLQHLLSAKEMLGWVILQIHNHHTMDLFFAGIRQSIARNSLDEDVHAFSKAYESQLPEKTGQGPRVRGYQYKAEGPGESKKNAVAFKHAMNDGKEKLAEATPPAEDVDAEDLEIKGFAEKEEL